MKSSEFRVKNLIVLIATLLTLHSALYTPVLAEEASAEASVKDKIEALKKEVASKAAQLKTEVNKDLQNKAYVGKITSYNSTDVTISSLSGEKNIKINEYTQFVDETTSKKTTNKLMTKNLAVGDFIAGLGDIDDKQVLTAKRVIKIKEYLPEKVSYFWGQVQKISGNSVTIKPRDGAEINITTLGITTYQLGSEEASFMDVKVNKYLAGVGTVIKNKKTSADFLYLIPSTGYVKPEKKVASPSATPK